VNRQHFPHIDCAFLGPLPEVLWCICFLIDCVAWFFEIGKKGVMSLWVAVQHSCRL
jgi:hypothetical protein